MIKIQTNAREVSRSMLLLRDQLPFTQMRTINRLAFQVRDDIRAGIEERFTIRSRWVVRGVQVPRGGTATKQNPQAVVELERQRMFLEKFEDGGRVVAPTGRPFAIPAEGQRHPRRLYPVNLGFFRRRAIEGGEIEAPAVHTTRRGVRQLRGRRRSFMLHPDHHRGVVRQQILQRHGRGEQGHLEWLWRLFDTINVPPLLRFQATAEQVVDEHYAEFFDEEFDKALRGVR